MSAGIDWDEMLRLAAAEVVEEIEEAHREALPAPVAKKPDTSGLTAARDKAEAALAEKKAEAEQVVTDRSGFTFTRSEFEERHKRKFTDEEWAELLVQSEEIKALIEEVRKDREEQAQANEDERSLRQERARRKARRLLDAEEAGATGLESWSPVDMSKVGATPIRPEVGHRSDGAPVFYKSRLNVLFGDSESGKSWLCLLVAAELINAGKRVTMLDYEDGPETAKVRLMQLGVPEAYLNNPNLFVYLNPNVMMSEEAFESVRQVFETSEMVIIDAFSEAAAVDGIDDYRAVQVAGWYTRVPRRIAALGPAVVLIDHVNKSTDSKAQQTGSQHKKSGVDGCSLRVSSIQQFAEGMSGASMVHIGKDRHSGLRKNSVRGVDGEPMRFAVLKVDESGNFELDPASEPLGAEEKALGRDVKRCYDLSAVIEEHGGSLESKNKARAYARSKGVKGNDTALNRALDELVAGGYVSKDFRHLAPFDLMTSGAAPVPHQ